MFGGRLLWEGMWQVHAYLYSDEVPLADHLGWPSDAHEPLGPSLLDVTRVSPHVHGHRGAGVQVAPIHNQPGAPVQRTPFGREVGDLGGPEDHTKMTVH